MWSAPHRPREITIQSGKFSNPVYSPTYVVLRALRRSRKRKSGNPEIGNRKSEIGNPEIRNRKSEMAVHAWLILCICFIVVSAQSSVEVIDGGNLVFINNGTTRIGISKMYLKI